MVIIDCALEFAKLPFGAIEDAAIIALNLIGSIFNNSIAKEVFPPLHKLSLRFKCSINESLTNAHFAFMKIVTLAGCFFVPKLAIAAFSCDVLNRMTKNLDYPYLTVSSLGKVVNNYTWRDFIRA